MSLFSNLSTVLWTFGAGVNLEGGMSNFLSTLNFSCIITESLEKSLVLGTASILSANSFCIVTTPSLNSEFQKGFDDFLKTVFSQRRKKLKNVIDTEIQGDKRPEELSRDELLEVFQHTNAQRQS